MKAYFKGLGQLAIFFAMFTGFFSAVPLYYYFGCVGAVIGLVVMFLLGGYLLTDESL